MAPVLIVLPQWRARRVQAALERTTYINALATDTRGKLDALDSDARQVAEAQSEANRAKAASEFQLRTLGEKTKLDERSKQLAALKGKIKEAVDGLSPADRRRWVDRNGTLTSTSMTSFVTSYLSQVPVASGSAAKEW